MTYQYHFAGGNVSREVVLHPPNLVNQDGNLHPNALVPFCAYQTKMLGERVDTPTNSSFIACSHFEPSIIDGQLCYSVDVNKAYGTKSGAGKGSGLLLVIDPVNPEHKEKYEKQENIDHMITTLNIERTNTDTQGLRIYLNTLEIFETFNVGSLAMQSLKKMTGTGSFLENENKDCSLETFEDCQARRYLEEVENQCGCFPWLLSTKKTVKVC